MKRIYRVLKERKSSQSELAFKSGIQLAAINRICRGWVRPTEEQVARMASVLDCTKAELLYLLEDE